MTRATAPGRRSRTRWSVSLLGGLETLCRLLLLNLLWTASVLPVVTAPGGTRAMFETLASWREADDLPVARVWWAAFRRHAVRAGLETLPLAVVGVLLVVNVGVVGTMGAQRTFVFPALLAVAIPVALIAAGLQPALTGRAERSVRDGYRIALHDILRSPAAAIVVLLIALAAALLIDVQPLLVLLVPAPAARLMLAARARLVRSPKEHA